jgi:hypothetical protein
MRRTKPTEPTPPSIRDGLFPIIVILAIAVLLGMP